MSHFELRDYRVLGIHGNALKVDESQIIPNDPKRSGSKDQNVSEEI